MTSSSGGGHGHGIWRSLQTVVERVGLATLHRRPLRSISTGYYAKNRVQRMFGPYASFAKKHPLMTAITISVVATAIFVVIGGGPPSLTF